MKGISPSGAWMHRRRNTIGYVMLNFLVTATLILFQILILEKKNSSCIYFLFKIQEQQFRLKSIKKIMSLRNLKYKINFFYFFIRVPKFYIKFILFYIF